MTLVNRKFVSEREKIMNIVMAVLSALIQLIPFGILLRWVNKIKTGEPFSKGFERRLVGAGALSLFIELIPSLALVLVMRFYKPAWVTIPMESAYLALLTAGLTEEAGKYLAFRFCVKNSTEVRSAKDMVLASCLVAMGFSLLENIQYAVLDGGSTLFRGLFPLHFLLAAIMGYFYSRAAETGEKKYHVLSLAVPVLIHGVFDFPMICLSRIMEQVDIAAIPDEMLLADPNGRGFMICLILMFLFIAAEIVMLIGTVRKLGPWQKEDAAAAA